MAEVFALNNFLITLLLYLALCFFQTRRPHYAYWGACVIGLGLCNQHTIVMYAIPLILVTLWYGRAQLLNVGSFVRLCGYGLAGLLPYVHLPLSALRKPPSTWGDHTTVTGILTHFLRKEYGTFQLASGHDKQSQWMLRLWLLAKTCRGDIHARCCTDYCRRAGVRACAAPATVWRAAGGHHCVYLIMFNVLANLDVNDTLFLGVQARFWHRHT